MKITAILTAGGTGSRMQKNIPKQFITVNEIPIIIYTLQQFQKNEDVDSIIVACIPGWQPMLRAYSQEFDISKLDKIVDGGETGIESIRNCFDTLDAVSGDDIILIHDGNRPLVDNDTIRRNIEAASEFGATSTYVDVHDGIIRVDKDLNIQRSDLRRDDIKSTQTPHTFRYATLKEIFSKIDNPSQYISLADAAVNLDHKIALVKGSEINFKITTPNDLVIFEAITNTRFNNV